MILTTTLNEIRKKDPCESGWVKLLKHLNKTKADDEELTFKTILESNGLDDALWCLRYANGRAATEELAAARDAARADARAAAWDAQKEQFIKQFCTED